jgi:hypothetical protein
VLHPRLALTCGAIGAATALVVRDVKRRRTRFRIALAVAGLLAALTLPPAASAAQQHDPRLDAAASDVAGSAVTVYGEDDPAAWDQWVKVNGPADWDGYSDIAASTVYLNPLAWGILEDIENHGMSYRSPYETAGGILVLTHEATHVRLQSRDEGRVSACALAMFPDVLERDFHVAKTVIMKETRIVPVRRRVRVRKRVRVHGRWVVQTVTVTRTVRTAVLVPVEEQNWVYADLVDQAGAVYRAQPPPYSTGVCF